MFDNIFWTRSLLPGILVWLKTDLVKMQVSLRHPLAMRPIMRLLPSGFFSMWTSSLPVITWPWIDVTPGSIEAFRRAPGKRGNNSNICIHISQDLFGLFFRRSNCVSELYRIEMGEIEREEIVIKSSLFEICFENDDSIHSLRILAHICGIGLSDSLSFI